jgi:Mg-chelatase subunit ChlD
MSTMKYEVALALDNTGSMLERGKIGALKEASNHLIDLLYEDSASEDRVKMALVPFATSVNIRGAAFKEEWLDPSGAGLGSHQNDSYDRIVSRLEIYDALSNGRKGADDLPVAWKGCVEARAGAHDIDDAAPGRNAATRWTPYLSPDGADRDTDRKTPSWAMHNSYLSDQTGGRGSALHRLRNTDKYFTPTVTARFNPFDTQTGPNQSCGSPIVELNSNKKRMHDAINAMEATGFTHIPQGLAWGWRVLSPGEPYDQGAPYDDEETQKVLVLLSDGKNTFPETYTSYGYQADGRLASSEWTGIRRLNEKVSTVCKAVKEKGIRIYTILLEENDAATRRIFEDCASVNDKGETLYFEVPDGDALTAAFEKIGDDMLSIHLSR